MKHMKNTSKRIMAYAMSAVMAMAFLQSCGGGDDKQVAELQRRLDSTMQQYENLKAQGGDYEQQLSSRDSAITAQAAEIQRLINQLSAARHRPAVSGDENARIERQQKEIRDKENTIRKLQQQIDQQTKQIAELSKSSQSGSSSAAQQKQVAELQGRIDEQQKLIASLQGDVKRLRDENSAAAKNSDKMKSDYESQLSSANSQLASMNTQLEGCRTQIDQLNAQLGAKDEEIKRLGKGTGTSGESAELKQLRKQLDEMSKKESDCRRQYDELTATANQNNSRYEADRNTLQRRIDELDQQTRTLQKRVDNLQSQNAALAASNSQQGAAGNAETKRMQKTIDDLNAQVSQQRQQIAQLESDLQQRNQELEAARNGGGKKADAGTVSTKIEELQRQCDSYLAEIERLRAENEQLKNENAELKERVASSADLFAENERLQQKVKLASMLVTTDIKVTPGKSLKIGNIVSPASKAKKVKVIRVDCRLLDNNVVDPGSMTIYARIANAANRVVANGQAESFDLSGTPMQYTMKQDIEFTGYGRNVAMIWKKSDDVELTPGLYWLTLYAGGYEIGKASFKLD